MNDSARELSPTLLHLQRKEEGGNHSFSLDLGGISCIVYFALANIFCVFQIFLYFQPNSIHLYKRKPLISKDFP